MFKRKDGQNKNEYDHLIINRPEALSSLRKGTEWSITTMGWVMWFLLCRPVLLAVLWIFGVRIFYEHMIRLGGAQSLSAFLPLYLSIILIIFLVVRGWNLYNFFKFSGKNRRVRCRIVTHPENEDLFGLPENSLKDIQKWDETVVSFGDGQEFMIENAKDPQQKFTGRSPWVKSV